MTSQELKEWREKKIRERDDERLIASIVITEHFEALANVAEELAKLNEPSKIETPYGIFLFHPAEPNN